MDTNPFRYSGEYWDGETENIYLRARMYDPGAGRFTAEDPAKDGLNWYSYCAGNPVMFSDASGLKMQIFGENQTVWEKRPLYDVACETGLLKKEDAFARNIDENLTYGTLRTLTERFLKQKRYLYFTFTWVKEGEPWGLWAYARKDEEGTQTYEEFAYAIHLTTDLYEPVKLYINHELMEENDAFWKPIPCLAIRPVIEKIGGTVEWTPEEITIRYGEKVFACQVGGLNRRTFKSFYIRELSDGQTWEDADNILIRDQNEIAKQCIILNKTYFELDSVSSILSRIGYSLTVDEEKREIYINQQP